MTHFHHIPNTREEDFAEELSKHLSAMLASKDLGIYPVEQNAAKLAIELQSFEEKYSKTIRHMKVIHFT